MEEEGDTGTQCYAGGSRQVCCSSGREESWEGQCRLDCRGGRVGSPVPNPAGKPGGAAGQGVGSAAGEPEMPSPSPATSLFWDQSGPKGVGPGRSHMY